MFLDSATDMPYLPDHDQLLVLPRRYAAAISLRCLMRVEPLAGTTPDDELNRGLSRIVFRTIEKGTAYCKGDESPDTGLFKEITTLTSSAVLCQVEGFNMTAAGFISTATMNFVTAIESGIVDETGDPQFWVSMSYTSAHSSATAARVATAGVPNREADDGGFVRAVQADYAALLKKSDELIDPTPHGPLGALWPDGEPEWFRRPPANE